MRRRPPRSTRVPYTTLFRSCRDDEAPMAVAGGPRAGALADPPRDRRPGAAPQAHAARRGRLQADHRSEEHTSELQSRQYLVCRLLLEKNYPVVVLCTMLGVS